ncbi:MAG: hypothetical protein R3F56_16125 [Planctomycetota bacterium]
MSRIGSWLAPALGASVVAGLFTFAWYAAQAAEHARLQAASARRLAGLRQERIDELERRLAGEVSQQERVRELVSQRVAAEERARQEQEQRLLAATQPLPEGLRLALEAVHDVLRRSGHAGLRFLSVRAIAEKEMRGVDLFELPDAASGAATLWRAERVDFLLDRTTNSLTIRLREGSVVRGGVAADLPDDGEAIVLLAVDGPMAEERLPFLVVASGEYARPEPAAQPQAKLDPFTAQSWRDRLNRLLSSATTPLRYRITEIEGLQDARFHGVLLLGQAEGKRLDQVAEVDRLAVVVDDAAGTVELELVGGVFHRAGGDTVLPEREPGQRILLPGLTPQAAARTLTGMVLRR